MAFFNTPHELAKLFTQEAYHNPEKQGKYLASGLKPIEEFCGDISQNLTEWAAEGNSIFYRTKNHWYVFDLDTDFNIVHMAQFNNGSWARMDDWANLHSVESLGKEFLKKHLDKRVPVFNN